MIIELKNEEQFVRIRDKDRLYYGGNQGWYIEDLGKEGGCGPVASANILAYYGLHHIGRKALFDVAERPLSKEDFKRHMNHVFDYLRPIEVPKMFRGKVGAMKVPVSLGVPMMFQLIKGTVRYGNNKGIKLTPVVFKEKFNIEGANRYIIEGLSRDYPIALLIFKNKHVKEVLYESFNRKAIEANIEMHWVTVTAIKEENGVLLLKASTWGGWVWIPLKACVNSTGFGGMVYFIDEV